jgi:hypothetical protein
VNENRKEQNVKIVDVCKIKNIVNIKSFLGERDKFLRRALLSALEHRS